jgi:hypothetical protein
MNFPPALSMTPNKNAGLFFSFDLRRDQTAIGFASGQPIVFIFGGKYDNFSSSYAIQRIQSNRGITKLMLDFLGVR